MLFSRNIANFSSLAPSALAESLEFVGWGPREKQTLCEKTLLAHFECVTCIEVELVNTRERQNIDIHVQRKNTTAAKILPPSTSMACFICPLVKIPSVPEDTCATKSQAHNFAERSQFYCWLPANVVQVDTCHFSLTSSLKTWRRSRKSGVIH